MKITGQVMDSIIMYKQISIMKKVYIVIISLSVCLTISGQAISLLNNRYRGSDVLEKKQIVLKGFSLNDAKGVWSS